MLCSRGKAILLMFLVPKYGNESWTTSIRRWFVLSEERLISSAQCRTRNNFRIRGQRDSPSGHCRGMCWTEFECGWYESYHSPSLSITTKCHNVLILWLIQRRAEICTILVLPLDELPRCKKVSYKKHVLSWTISFLWIRRSLVPSCNTISNLKYLPKIMQYRSLH